MKQEKFNTFKPSNIFEESDNVSKRDETLCKSFTKSGKICELKASKNEKHDSLFCWRHQIPILTRPKKIVKPKKMKTPKEIRTICGGKTLKNLPCKRLGSNKQDEDSNYCSKHQNPKILVPDKNTTNVTNISNVLVENTDKNAEEHKEHKKCNEISEGFNNLDGYFRKDKKDFHRFRGKFKTESEWLLHIQKSLGNDLTTVWHIKEYAFLYSWRKTKNHCKGLTVQDWFLSMFGDKTNKIKSRFFIGIVSMKVKGGLHSNALIFDNKDKTLTRYEPHGKITNVYDMEHADKCFVDWLKDVNSKIGKWKYVSPLDYSPSIGPQTKSSSTHYEKKTGMVFGKKKVVESGGYCSAWSLLFLHYRISNPEKSVEFLAESMAHPTAKVLNDKIREYSACIVNQIFPNKISKTTKTSTIKKENLYKIGECVSFCTGKGKDCGKIIRTGPNNARIFCINNAGKKLQNVLLPYYIFVVSYESLDKVVDENMIEIINKKHGKYEKKINSFKVGDYVQFKAGNGTDYGQILKIIPKSFKVFSINFTQVEKSGKIPQFAIYTIQKDLITRLTNTEILAEIQKRRENNPNVEKYTK